MAYRVNIILTGSIDHHWPAFAEGLERACLSTGGDITSHYLWSECRNGAAFLLAVWKEDGEDGEWVGASVWRFEDWQTGKKLRCLGGYGTDLMSWIEDARRVVIALAKTGQATAIIDEGRKGLQRLFPEAKILRQLYEVEI